MSSRSGPALRDELLRAYPELRSVPPPAWVVGGAIRDLLLGRPPADVDIATPSGLAAAEALASGARGRIVPLGRERFPTWRVLIDGRACDVSTIIGSSIEEDLARRDFTINALALPLRGKPQLLDPFGGEADIDARRVRMVSRRNLVDDPLRILKAVRLAATLGFQIEAATLAACAAEGSRLSVVAGERIGAELEMMVSGGEPAVIGALLRASGIDEVLFGRRVPEALARLRPGDPVVIWSAIFTGAGREELREAAGRLRWPAALAGAVAAVRRSLREVQESGLDPARLDPILYDAGAENAARVAALAHAAGDEAAAAAVRARIRTRGEALFSIEPLLDGDEIGAAARIDAGPGVGRLKRELLLEQIAGRVTSRKEALLWVRRRAGAVNR